MDSTQESRQADASQKYYSVKSTLLRNASRHDPSPQLHGDREEFVSKFLEDAVTLRRDLRAVQQWLRMIFGSHKQRQIYRNIRTVVA